MKFDSVAEGVSLAGWTVNAPETYNVADNPPYIIKVVKDAKGFTLVATRGGFSMFVK